MLIILVFIKKNVSVVYVCVMVTPYTGSTTPLLYMVCSDPESGTDHSIKEVSAYIIFGTWYKHEASRVNATSYFFALLCIFTNNIHVIVKFSSAEGTCILLYNRLSVEQICNSR